MEKKMIKIGLFLFLCAHSLWAFGDQRGNFESRSTQGPQWNGTANIVSEHLTITVHPDYLDVELDLEFGVGGTPPEEHLDALEIVGRMNLERGAVAVGMLVWYKNLVLKSKIKQVRIAREQYEDVVDRDIPVPPRPRDPVLFELTGNDRYDISIFPVEWGQTRKLRLKYLIPCFKQCGYPHAFSDRSTVTIKRGDVSSFSLITNGYEEIKITDETIELSEEEYSFMAYERTEKKRLRGIKPHLLDNNPKIITSEIDINGFNAHVSHLMGDPSELGEKEWVILWRMNHYAVIKKYMKQIILQSGLLLKFLQEIKQEGEMVSLIINTDVGDDKIFTLSSPGDTEYDKMIAWLTELNQTQGNDYIKGDRSGLSQAKIDSLLHIAQDEFENSLLLAKQQFSNRKNVLKKLLLVTSGPRWMYQENSYVKPSVWNDSIAVTDLKDELRITDYQTLRYLDDYWPGVRIGSFRYQQRLTHKMVMDFGGRDINKPFNYTHTSWNWSDRSFNWDLRVISDHAPADNGKMVPVVNGIEFPGFAQTIEVVQARDQGNFARLHSAFSNIVPLHPNLPRSLAGTIGFVDREFALLALEEDALAQDIIPDFLAQGVPELGSDDVITPDILNLPPTQNQGSTAQIADANEKWSTNKRFKASFKTGILTISIDPQLMRNPDASFRFTIRDSKGRIIDEFKKDQLFGNKFTWSLPGKYRGQVLFLTLQVGNKMESVKFVIPEKG